MKTAITLLELLVVIALVGIIAGVGWPNLVGWNCRQEHRNDFERFNHFLKEVQSVAINRNKTTLVRVTPSPQNSNSLGTLKAYLLQNKSCTTSRAQSLENEIPTYYFHKESELKTEHNRNQCFYADGSADYNTFTLRRSCGGKNLLYRIQMFAATGLISKEKFNFKKNTWEDL